MVKLIADESGVATADERDAGVLMRCDYPMKG
jgi:hypothetical protein